MAEQAARHGASPKSYAKTDIRYWEQKIFHDAYTRDGERIQMSEWSVRIQHEGRRETFQLETPNKAAAAAKAKGIFFSLRGGGWEDTLRRFKPTIAKPEKDGGKGEATVGDLLAGAQPLAGVRARTFADYSKSFRKIVADIFEIDGGRAKFDPHTGGRQKWLGKIDAIKLSDITPEKVQKWKIGFLEKAQKDPISQRRAKISVNSLLRQAKSLFSKRITRFLTIELPSPLPFDGVTFEPRQSMRFQSAVDIRKIIAEAKKELDEGQEDKPEQYQAFLLAVCAGLRRSEIDLLEWDAFDFEHHTVRIASTEFLNPKTEESRALIEIDPEIAAIFSKLAGKASGRFVIESSGQIIRNANWSHYRCAKVFDGLLAWLREKGIRAQKPIHELRKELGAAITNEHGIYAASRVLRHADITITTQHYADKQRRASVGFGKLITP